MNTLFQTLPAEVRAQLRETPAPDWLQPMLATLTDRRFSDKDWLFERKFDGERCLAYRDGDRLRLLSRNRLALNDTYPEVAEALAEQTARRFVTDGEIVAFEGSATSFARLQGRMQITDPVQARRTGIAVYYYLFDLLYLDTYDITSLPLLDRKRLLRKAFAFRDPLRYSVHRHRDGEAFYREACRQGWEGLIAKRADSPYTHRRSQDWLKFKCLNEQEFVVGGYTDPEGARTGFGALLVGYYEQDKLRYAGKVGTGYDRSTLEALGAELRSLAQDHSPFTAGDAPTRGVHWVTPRLVVEVAFAEWTRAGKLRQPRYLGRRRDKRARDVIRERA
jgi:DNA ligase D-like protein (predicted ligase)